MSKENESGHLIGGEILGRNHANFNIRETRFKANYNPNNTLFGVGFELLEVDGGGG